MLGYKEGFNYPHLANLSSAYETRIHQFFFTLQTGTRDNDLVLAHTEYRPDTDIEISELKTAALAWQDLTPPPPNSKRKWKLKHVPPQGYEKESLQHSIRLPDRTTLILTITTR